ncbi:L-carnitine dehydratase/bile acid-inducible protein F [Acidovorax delafieldii 2AN]|uniref:L-carnitine dehydratase/bile acid-inducible protein F n=1 Tax=Acidovorax delafieldii 2AN TaxID=573060 RepID=C5TAX3_ACIDE|nr:CoA transferase [Acidovorax delafieldii]EER58373.1 L-carnitine dehydratase/bile acid-inducible protein F [Acidovorax delafieldii 2AN]
MSAASRPLEGIRVLDLTVAVAGPYGALLLGGLGAEVIHIEAPGGGDIARTNQPFVGSEGLNFGPRREGEVSLSILNRARNKKSVTLDLKRAEGRDLFLQLARESDVVLENLSEGAAARLGVGYEAVSAANPRIVYGSISAFGVPSLYPGVKGVDILVQAASGLMEVTGFADGPPVRCGIPIADLLAPVFAVNGILSALIQRGRTGKGQHVQVSMLDCLASILAEEHFDIYAQAGYPMRSGNSQDRMVPFGTYRCSDGQVAIVAFRPEWLKELFDAMGRPELQNDPRFASRDTRMRNAIALNRLIEEWTGPRTTAAVVQELLKRQIPAVRVRTAQEVLHDPQLLARGAVMELLPPSAATRAIGMGNPIQFSDAHAQFDQPAQALGQANEEIYGGLLKMSRQDLDRLSAAGVI